MARICNITKKRTVAGNNVSHSKRRVKRTFKPNLHTKTFLVPGKVAGTFTKIKLKLSSKAIRIIDKLGIEKVIKKYNIK